MEGRYICPNCGRFMHEKVKKSWVDYSVDYECECGYDTSALDIEYTDHTTIDPNYLEKMLGEKL